MKSFFSKIGEFFKKYLTLVIIAIIFLVLFICDNSSSRAGGVIMDNLKSIATSFTPTTDLFDDGSEVSFVSYFFGMRINKPNEKCVFNLPTSNQNISTTDDYLCYNYLGVVCAVAKGRVKTIGYTKAGEKYVEIEHSESYVSRYVGNFVLGVASGDYVDASSPILTLDGKNPVRIYIHKDENLVKTNEIEWKN